jgi:hypothetical protein
LFRHAAQCSKRAEEVVNLGWARGRQGGASGPVDKFRGGGLLKQALQLLLLQLMVIFKAFMFLGKLSIAP